MAALRSMDGAWRGRASIVLADGTTREFVQTERIGPFLGDTVKVIEGRGYDKDGSVRFNALGIVSYDPRNDTYTLRPYAQGLAGDFPFRATADGYAWEIDRGGTLTRYTARITADDLHEVGERVSGGRAVVFFDMRLKRIGDTTWPLAGPILSE